MINTEEILMGEKEVLKQWKRLLVRQCNSYTHKHRHTPYNQSLCVSLWQRTTIKPLFIIIFLSFEFCSSSCLETQDYGVETWKPSTLKYLSMERSPTQCTSAVMVVLERLTCLSEELSDTCEESQRILLMWDCSIAGAHNKLSQDLIKCISSVIHHL